MKIHVYTTDYETPNHNNPSHLLASLITVVSQRTIF